MVRTLFCLIAVSTALTVPANGGEIPFTLEKGFVIISGKVKDEPIQVAVFTGSTFSFFNRDLVKRLKINLSSTNDILSGVAKEDALVFADVPDITFADQRPTELKMRQGSFDVMEKSVGHKIDAIIGLDYLNGRIVQFDFQKRVVRFIEKPPFDYESNKKLGDPFGLVQVAMRMDEHLRTIFGVQVSMPIAREVTVNGSLVRTLFDTGAVYPVTIAPFTAKKNSIGSVSEKESFAKVQLKSISLSGYEMRDVPALIKSSWDDTETRYAAIVGVGVLQNFTVTFDWKNKWIALEK